MNLSITDLVKLNFPTPINNYTHKKRLMCLNLNMNIAGGSWNFANMVEIRSIYI